MNASLSDAAKDFENEHRELEVVVNEIRVWWNQIHELGEPHFGEMGDKLITFREKLSEHFKHEEQAGVLDFVVTTAAEDVQKLADLRDEHAALLSDLDELISRLKALEPKFEFWGDSGAEFEQFLCRLEQHEQRESSLIAGYA